MEPRRNHFDQKSVNTVNSTFALWKQFSVTFKRKVKLNPMQIILPVSAFVSTNEITLSLSNTNLIESLKNEIQLKALLSITIRDTSYNSIIKISQGVNFLLDEFLPSYRPRAIFTRIVNSRDKQVEIHFQNFSELANSSVFDE